MANVLTRKIQLIPVGDKDEVNRVYNFIRDAQYSQYLGLNRLMSELVVAFYQNNRQLNSDFNEKRKRILSNSNTILDDIEFSKGCDTKSQIVQKVRADFNKALKNGLAKGEIAVTNYKRTNPLLVRGRDLKFCHNYDTFEEFEKHLFNNDLEVYIKFVNYIQFKIVFGSPHKSMALRSEIKEIISKNYSVQGSSIQIEDKKIILNLSMSVPVKEIELDENVIVGVDLGLAIPAVCALNTNDYIKKSIGSAEDFLRQRTKIQNQKRTIQKNLVQVSGGHGRKKKLRHLEKIRKSEEHWVRTYNHFVSKQVVDFAIKNKAKYINVEDLSGFDSSKFILRNWSYYQLQEFITYKAKNVGIEVRKVDPYHTSQTCSCCGHWEEGQRVSQSKFICKNPNCKNYQKEINADFNAARNIAQSKDFKKKQKA